MVNAKSKVGSLHNLSAEFYEYSEEVISGRTAVGILKQFVQTPIRYIGFIKKVFLKENPRFLILTFGIFRIQWILDFETLQIIKVETPTLEDFRVLLQIFYYEHYKIEKSWINKSKQKSAEDAQHQEKLILDLGGNIGLSAIYFSLTIKNSTIILVEPSERNINLAKKNTKGRNCIYLQGAISSNKAKVKLVDPGKGSDAYRVEIDDSGPIQTFTINEILGLTDINPYLVKIDIEGFEQDLFERETSWIDRFSFIVIELHDWMLLDKFTSKNFLREISKRDRNFIYKNENIFSF